MSIRGLMDGWHGDETECRGHCGTCDICEAALERKADEEIDRYLSEED